MAGNYKRAALGLIGFVPEVNQGYSPFEQSSKSSGNTTTSLVIEVTSSTSALYPAGLADATARQNFLADYFNGLSVYLPDSEEHAYITDTAYVEASSALTLTITPALAAARDSATFYIFGRLPATSDFTVGKENLTRLDFRRGSWTPPSNLKGLSQVEGSLETELLGLETPISGAGATVTLDRYSHLLSAVGTRSAHVADTVQAGSTTTTINLSTSEANVFSAGDAVLIEGQVAYVTEATESPTGDTIVIAPALSATPTAAEPFHAGEKFTPDDTGQLSLTMVELIDDQLIQHKGCIINVSLASQFSQTLTMTVEATGEDFQLTDSFTIAGNIPLASKNSTPPAPVKFVQGRAFFGSTELDCNNIDFNYNIERSVVRDTGDSDTAQQSVFVTGRAPSAGVSFRNKAKTFKDTTEANGTQARLLLQFGNEAGSTVAIIGNAQPSDPATYGDNEGISTYDATFAFVDDEVSTTYNKAFFYRF